MRKGFCRAGLMVLLLALSLGLVLTDAAPAQVLINELLADPATDWNGDGEVDTKLDEWVEVYNAGTEAVSLTKYYLRDGLGDTPHLNMFGTLEPGAVAVFYGSNALAWQTENGAGTSGFSLNNTGDTVQLLLVNADDPDVLDVVDERIYLPHEGAEDRSTGRLPDGDAWSLFDELNPYGGDELPAGNGCSPSPGMNNECDEQTPVSEANWSAVKEQWR